MENVNNLRKLEESVESLCLDFTLPGQPNFELKVIIKFYWKRSCELFNDYPISNNLPYLNFQKNGKNIPVSLDNLEDYLQVKNQA